MIRGVVLRLMERRSIADVLREQSFWEEYLIEADPGQVDKIKDQIKRDQERAKILDCYTRPPYSERGYYENIF